MKTAHIWLLATLIILIIGTLTLAFNPNSSTQPKSEKTTIAVSIFPLADIARNVAGDKADVIQLIPSGSSPHTYSLTPQQLADLSTASTLFIIGHQLEPASLINATKANSTPVQTVDNGITLLPFEKHEENQDAEHEEEHGELDPHYWLSVPNAQIIARNIKQTLQSIDPANAYVYQENFNQYSRQLTELENNLQDMSRIIANPAFIAIHDAWSYFTEQYNLDLVATYEPTEGQQPTLSDLNNLKEIAKEHKLSVFYTEPQKQSTSAIRLIQNELNLGIGILDPVGGISPNDTYIDLMLNNMNALAPGE